MSRRITHRLPSGVTRVQQNQANDSNINILVARYLRTGQQDPRLAGRRLVFGDFTSTDFQDMMNRVTDVQNQFRSLPSRIRSRFSNQPFQLVRFVEDPSNRVEAIKMGLLLPTEEEVVAAEGAAAASKVRAGMSRQADAEQVDLVEESEDPPPPASKKRKPS